MGLLEEVSLKWKEREGRVSQSEGMASAKAPRYAVQTELFFPPIIWGPQGRDDVRSTEWPVQIYS